MREKRVRGEVEERKNEENKRESVGEESRRGEDMKDEEMGRVRKRQD